MKDLVENCFVGVAFKRWIATQNYEQNNAQRPNVALIVVVAFKYFWCNVEWSADNGVHMGVIGKSLT